jgi:hypothetical protein
MSCGELFVNLGGGGSTPPNGMLQTTAALSGSLQVVKDNLGNSSTLSLSTQSLQSSSPFVYNGSSQQSGFNILSNAAGSGVGYNIQSYGTVYAGSKIVLYGQTIESDYANGLNIGTVNSTVTNNGKLTIKGSGGNLLSLRDSSNVEKVYIADNGFIYGNYISITGGILGTQYVGFAQGTRISENANGTLLFRNSSSTSFFAQFGGDTSSFPAIKRNGAAIDFRLADDSGYAGIATGIGSALAFQVDKVSSTAAIGFFAASPINQVTNAIANAAFADGGGGSSIKTTDTFGGYTLQQVVQALLNYGLLRP